MSTTMPKAADISRKWYVLDAAGKPLGRVAAKAADLLRGKHKPTFAPHMDCGDHVVIINCEKAVLTGKKLEQKYYRWHTGWVGHLKEVKYAHLMEANPEKAMMLAVKGMVPDTVEYGQWKSHIRQESLIFGGGSLGFKIGTGVTSAIMTGLLEGAGFLSSTTGCAVQPETAKSMICSIYWFGPILVWAVAVVVLLFYKLDRKYPTIMKELAEREARGEM